jgi:hypothetical protein
VVAGALALIAMVIGRASVLGTVEPGLHPGSHGDPAIAFATLSLIVLAATPALRVVLLAGLWQSKRTGVSY